MVILDESAPSIAIYDEVSLVQLAIKNKEVQLGINGSVMDVVALSG